MILKILSQAYPHLTGEYFRKKETQFFANQILGKILIKTSILMQNCSEDDMVRRNWQNM